MNWVGGTLYPGVKCPRGQDTVPTGGTFYPGVKCRRGQDTGGGGGKINRYTGPNDGDVIVLWCEILMTLLNLTSSVPGIL